MNNLTLTELVTLYPSAIEVLNHYNFDFCCNGSQNFAEACENLNLDSLFIFQQIKNADTIKIRGTSLIGWDLSLLSYIILEQSEYLRHATGQLLESLYELDEDSSGNNLQVIKTIYSKFKSLAEELTDHSYEEGEMLRLIMRLSAKGKAVNVIDQHVLANRQIEHYNVIQQLRAIRNLAKEHALRNPSFRMTHIQLEHFDTILTTRIYIENSVLYPQLSA